MSSFRELKPIFQTPINSMDLIHFDFCIVHQQFDTAWILIAAFVLLSIEHIILLHSLSIVVMFLSE